LWFGVGDGVGSASRAWENVQVVPHGSLLLLLLLLLLLFNQIVGFIWGKMNASAPSSSIIIVIVIIVRSSETERNPKSV
jgi:hypothetical protein